MCMGCVTFADMQQTGCLLAHVEKWLNNNNNRRLVTLAEHTPDHGKQTNSNTDEWGDE